jgi:hypothetical protein
MDAAMRAASALRLVVIFVTCTHGNIRSTGTWESLAWQPLIASS